MANLFDLLTNAGNKIKNSSLFEKLTSQDNFKPQSWDDYAKNMRPLQAADAQPPKIEFTQLSGGPSVNEARLEQPIKSSFGNTLYNALLGKKAEATDTIGMPQTNENGETIINSTISANPRTGGILRDISGGYQENRFTPASLENFGQNTLSDGRNKGFAYRLGEGLGTVGRVLESPLGRGLLTAGLVGATGGGGLEALAYGSTAGALNQANRSADRIYRDDLIQSQQNALKNSPEFANLPVDEQQAQMQDIADKINSQRGYINRDIYRNLTNTQQIRDNADWKRLYFDAQQKNIEAQREWQRQQAEMQRAEAAANRAVQMRGQDLNYKLGSEKLGTNTGLDKATQKTVNENMQILSDIQAGLQLLEQNPNAYSWIKGKLGADITNRIDPKGIRTRTAIDNITAVYRKWLTGAQMSDAERKAYERFLPAPTDNYQTVKAKLEGMQDSIQRRNDVLMGGYNIGLNTNSDPLGIL